MSKIDDTNQCEGCIYLGRYGSGKRRWATCACTASCKRAGGGEVDRFEAIPTVVPNPAGKDDNRMVKICSKCGKIMSIFEANVCGKCKSPIRQMHEQIERLCERMNVAEKIMATGYIYPKTLPADAVIVIRAPMRLVDSEMDYIIASVRCVWPNNMVHVFHSGLSMEIIEGSKHVQT